MKPNLSIIIPTKNRPRLLRRAVESVRFSCRFETNIIVVNDGLELDHVTTDFLLANDASLETSKQPGAGAARNTGISAAETEFVAFLDDDDELLPGYDIAVLHDFPAEQTFRWVGIDTNSGSSNVQNLPPSSKATWLARATASLSAGIGFGVCTRRDDLLAIGGFDQTLRLVEDTDLFLRMIASGFKPLPISRCLVRVHSDADSRQTDPAQYKLRIKEAQSLFTKHQSLLEENQEFSRQLENGIRWLRQEVEEKMDSRKR